MLARIAALLRFQPPVVDNRGLLFGSGADYPTLGSDGWQTGAIWCNTSGDTGTALYVNEGDVTSCNFVAVDTVAGASAGAIEFDDNTTGPLISIETTDPTNDSYTTPFIITGAYSSSADNALVLSATNTRPVSFLFEDSGDALGAADYRAGLFRVLLTVDQTNAITLNALRAQIKANDEVDITSASSVTAPFTGYLELDGAGARTLNGHVACVRAALETGAGAHTLGRGLAGFESTLNSSGTFTAAKLFAYTANISGGTTTWQFGYKVEDSSCDTGVGIGTCTTGIELAGATTTDSMKISTTACQRAIFITGGCMDGIKLEGSTTTRRFMLLKADLGARHAEANDDSFWGIYLHQTHGIDAAAAHFIGLASFLDNDTGDAFQQLNIEASLHCSSGVNRLAAFHAEMNVTAAPSASGAAWGDTGMRYIGALIRQNPANDQEGEAAIAIDDDWNAGIWMDPSELTHAIKFQAAGGCMEVNAADVTGTATTHALRIDIGGVDHWIPVYDTKSW